MLLFGTSIQIHTVFNISSEHKAQLLSYEWTLAETATTITSVGVLTATVFIRVLHTTATNGTTTLLDTSEVLVQSSAAATP